MWLQIKVGIVQFVEFRAFPVAPASCSLSVCGGLSLILDERGGLPLGTFPGHLSHLKRC